MARLEMLLHAPAPEQYSLLFTSYTTLKYWHRAPHLCIYHLKRRRFIASYVQPVIQQYESTTVYKKNFCNQRSHYKNYGLGIEAIKCLPQEQRWMGHKGGPLKNALYVQRHSKRHLSGWSDVRKQKNQARSLSHCQVTRIWRHQSVSQAIS